MLSMGVFFCHSTFATPLNLDDDNLVLEKSLLVDRGGKLDVELASKGEFKPYDSNVLMRGFTTSASWIRIQVKALPNNEPAIIRIQPHFLDDIDFYEKSATGWSKRSAGDKVPYSASERNDSAYSFIIHPKLGQKNTYYLRIKTSGITYVSFQILSIDGSYQAAQNEQWVYGLQLGALLLFLCWGIVDYWNTHNKILARFIVFQIFVILFSLSNWGVLSRFVFPNSAGLDNDIFHYLFFIRTATCIWLIKKILDLYNPPAWYKKCCQIAYVIFFFELFLFSAGIILPALLLNLMVWQLIPPLHILTVLCTKSMPRNVSRLLIFGFSMSIATFAASMIFIGGHVNYFSQPIIVLSWFVFVNEVIFYLVIKDHNYLAQKELLKSITALRVIEVQEKLNVIKLNERSTLIDMLVHELKNPLAAIKMALGTLKLSLVPEQKEEIKRIASINQAINNMDAVIEECMLMDQFDQRQLKNIPSKIHLSEWLEGQLEARALKDSITLEIKNDLQLNVDPRLLNIAINNLLDNAMKYSAQNTPILLTVESTANGAEATATISLANVMDSSSSIDESKIFSRYYRSPHSNSKSGTGLGLVLVKSICEILGGTISYRSVNNLAIFTIHLPCFFIDSSTNKSFS